jgi:hypothetical protein
MGSPGCRRIKEEDWITVALFKQVIRFLFYRTRAWMKRKNETRNLRGQSSMKTVMGDILKSKSTEELYKVKKI